jgi:hypothetical protein
MRTFLRGVALALLSTIGNNALPAQNMEGSVMVHGNADSLHQGFTAYLKQRAIPIQAQDSSRRTLRFLPADAGGEAVNARFIPRGDSTLIEARGVRGGIVALVMGMGTVHSYVKHRDSTAAPVPPPVSPPHALTTIGTDGRASEAAAGPPRH